MHPLPADLFLRALSPTDAATPLRVQARVHEAFPGMVSIATTGLGLEAYADLGHCALELLGSPPPLAPYTWGGPDDDRLVQRVTQGCFRVTWGEELLFVLRAGWPAGGQAREHQYEWVVGRAEATLRGFVLDVARKTHAIAARA